MGWSAGTYTRARNWVQDKINLINPQAALFDQEDDATALGLNNCVTKDGLNKPSATMDWNGQRLTALADATAATDAVNRQFGDGRFAAKGATDGSGSFTATLTGMTIATTGTVFYRVAAGVAYLWCPSGMGGTSNSTSMTMTGLPAAVKPTSDHYVPTSIDTVGSFAAGMGLIAAGSQTILFSDSVVSGVRVTWSVTGFNGGGLGKGIHAGWTFSYPLD